MSSPFNAYRRSQRANRFYLNPCFVTFEKVPTNSLRLLFDRPVGIEMADMLENLVCYSDGLAKQAMSLAVVSVTQEDDFNLVVLFNGATATVELVAFVGQSPGMTLQAVGYAVVAP